MGNAHTLGTHNLEDDAGVVTLFADVLLFTEAVPGRIRDKVKAAASRVAARARGRAVIVCAQQPDLVVVLPRRLFRVTGHTYTPVIREGLDLEPAAGVTPNRGTFVVLTSWRRKADRRRRPRAFLVEHRINAAFPPFIRGEAVFRRKAWHAHTRTTADLVQRLIDSGYDVDAGGDPNTPPGISAYPVELQEVGDHFDRLASTDRLVDVQVLSRAGSDHHRLKATVRS